MDTTVNDIFETHLAKRLSEDVIPTRFEESTCQWQVGERVWSIDFASRTVERVADPEPAGAWMLNECATRVKLDEATLKTLWTGDETLASLFFQGAIRIEGGINLGRWMAREWVENGASSE